MNYLVAVLSDRRHAETACSALESAGLPLSQISILGKGYKNTDEFGLVNPNDRALRLAKLMSFWLVPFGFAGGLTFSLITGLHTFAWAGEIGNHLIGGILGAIGGAMGSMFAGGGVAMSSESEDALPYRNQLSVGKYLVVVRGTEAIIEKATGILQPLKPEHLQGYSET